ncbi:Lrp/AsnC family transcriptional regulator [Jhaorihella thermophila]|uniref:Siroheme decarboxylase NirG subunit n=1 Tax=Jhaorihella thermophila TaxID=488547 RepID=A0A1H5X9E9_9RHOB|nr:Lrp/AsnC family transcriptional regulator [Jhaorihella thermophila]SEG08065.1 DNA-binding transcriptional regulator, Lrp family [Jhaorihella thermophila]
MSGLDDLDRAILNAAQEDLPLTHRPFAALAGRLGIGEAEVLARLHRMKQAGIITRFGPFFDAAAMGGAFCLCAMAVPRADFETVLTKVNAMPEVAHNYERAHRLNMWFVLATETPEGIEAAAEAIERETGLTVHRFPKLQEFYIGFRVAA